MHRTVPLALALLALTLAPTRARADGAGPSTVLIAGGGGQVEVTVHPDIITSITLPEPVTNVLVSDQERFAVKTMGNAVVVKALPASQRARRRGKNDKPANLVITTASLSVTVILVVTDDPNEAQAQITLKRAEVERELEKRVEAEVAKRLAATEAAMKRRIRLSIAERIGQRFEETKLTAVDRNSDHVIVRIPRRYRVGGDVFLRVRIQNRSDRTYELARCEVVAAGHDLAGGVVFEGKAARGPVLGEVPPGGRAELLVVVRDVDRIKTDDATLTLSEAGGRRPVRVSGVAIR